MIFRYTHQFIFLVLFLALGGCATTPYTEVVKNPQTNLKKYVLQANILESATGEKLELRLRYVDHMEYILGDVILRSYSAKYAFDSAPNISLVINGKKHLLRFLFTNNRHKRVYTTIPIYGVGFVYNHRYADTITSLVNTVIIPRDLLKTLVSKGSHELHVESPSTSKVSVFAIKNSNMKAIAGFLDKLPCKLGKQ